MASRIPYRNTSGCPDPTARDALTAVQREQDEPEQRMSRLIKILKNIIDLADFDLTARIEVRDRKSGRYFK